jgi:hypothetical protein
MCWPPRLALRCHAGAACADAQPGCCEGPDSTASPPAPSTATAAPWHHPLPSIGAPAALGSPQLAQVDGSVLHWKASTIQEFRNQPFGTLSEVLSLRKWEHLVEVELAAWISTERRPHSEPQDVKMLGWTGMVLPCNWNLLVNASGYYAHAHTQA